MGGDEPLVKRIRKSGFAGFRRNHLGGHHRVFNVMGDEPVKMSAIQAGLMFDPVCRKVVAIWLLQKV